MLNLILLLQNGIDILLLFTGIILSFVFLYVKIVSIIEKEYRAAKISFVFSVISLMSFLILYFNDFDSKILISIILLGIVYIIFLILFIPIRPKIKGGFQKPIQKHDERDVMFSRNEIKPATDKFEQYYLNNPDKKELDDKFRDKPGLLSPNSSMYHLFSFASADANLEVI
ncbi:hypothetical protein ACFLQ3_01540, partial [Bacteroidota bacterium]